MVSSSDSEPAQCAHCADPRMGSRKLVGRLQRGVILTQESEELPRPGVAPSSKKQEAVLTSQAAAAVLIKPG